MIKFPVAAIGLGWVAEHRHLRAMKRNRAFEVVGVIDRHPGRAHQIMLKNGYRYSSESADLTQVDWLEGVAAVTIATSPMSHYALIRQALELGKHVLTEKPFTMTVAEGEELVALAKARKRRLGVVHNFQFARSTKQLLHELAVGRLGAVRSVSGVQLGNPRRRLPSWYDQLPCGLLYDESPHLLYLLRLFAGDLRLDRSVQFPSSTGLNTPARFEAYFESPTLLRPVTLSCNFESPVSEWYLMVFGEKRLGVVDVFRDIYVSMPNDEAHDTKTVLRSSVSAIGQHMWQHLISGVPHLTGRLLYGNDEVFARFAQAVHGSDEDLGTIGPDSALAILRLQHAMIENAETLGSRQG